MFRNRILLVSLLKPVTDTRMYEKLGKSLLKLPQVEVHVAGYKSGTMPIQEDRLYLHPLFNFKRLSLQRFVAQWRYWQLLTEINPGLVIIGTHELLLTSWLYSILRGCKLVYDVRENYSLNLSTQNIYRNGLGKLMAKLVRGIEELTSKRIQHFFLAENAYAHELPFIGSKYSILPNKYLAQDKGASLNRDFPVLFKNKKGIKILYSGTISRIYGTIEAVRFTEQLRKYIPAIELVIIGYCAEAAYLEELKTEIAHLPYITLIGGDHLVPHSQIIEQERVCHIGLLPYQPHLSTFSCIPTKLYEYLANGLVVISQSNPPWNTVLEETGGGFPFDFRTPVNIELIELLLNKVYYSSGLPKGIYWHEEEPLLLSVIQDIL